MTKMYKKSDCEFKNNHIVCGDEIVVIDRVVFKMLDVMEESVQKAQYILNQPAPQETPSDEGFERITARSCTRLQRPFTPFTDKKVMEAMKLMEEADQSSVIDDINNMLDELQPVLDFVHSDYIIESPNGTIEAFNLYVLGNPLELTSDKIVDAVVDIKNADLHIAGGGQIHNNGRLSEEEWKSLQIDKFLKDFDLNEDHDGDDLDEVDPHAKVCDLMAKDIVEFLETTGQDHDGDTTEETEEE